MNVGVCQIQLRLPENHSLKGKRRVIKSIITRLHNKFNISAAEVDNHDSWQLATLGLTCVSNHRSHDNETLSHAIKFITQNYPELELVNSRIDIFSAP